MAAANSGTLSLDEILNPIEKLARLRDREALTAFKRLRESLISIAELLFQNW
ncbi:MAG: hypothetical protein PVI90_04755 [Desulfobacteraceae bacterium]|jgi:hypothetical protein